MKIVTLATNKLIDPIGCAVILFAAGALGARLADGGPMTDVQENR